MLNKIYKNYELNKKYGIRKLSIGIASVSLGLFGVYNTDLVHPLKIVHIVKADEIEQPKVIYTNPNANGEIDENGTNNNAISKIEVVNESDKKIRLRISIIDGVDVSKGFVLKNFKTLYSGYYEPLSFNNEEIGEIPYVSNTVKKVKKPNEFSNINEYYSYIQSLDSESDEFNQELKLKFNDKFKKYDKNRVIEFNLEITKDTSLIDYLYKKNETPNEKTKMLEEYYKNVVGNIYINNTKIYSMKNSTKLNLRLENLDNNVTEKEYNEADKINNNASGVVDVENKPTYLSKLYVNNPESFNKTPGNNGTIYINSAHKKLIKAGTKFRITLNSNVVDLKNNSEGVVTGELNYSERTPNKFKIKEIFEGEQLVEKEYTEKASLSYYKTPISYKKIDNNTYELEVLDDVVVKANSLYGQSVALPYNLYKTKLKEDFLNHIDVLAYKKALETGNFGNLLGTITTEIKEPTDTDYIKKEVSQINAWVSTSYVFGESSTGTVKVVYVDENNKDIAPAETIAENQPWYNKIEIPKKEFDGYEFVSTSSSLKDLVMPGERTVTLKYKSTEKTREIPFNTIYEADNTKNKNEREIVRGGVNGEEKYKSLNGEDIPGSVRVTKEKVDKLVKVGTKPKEIVTKLPSPIKYVKDDTKEKGLPNERIEGKTGTSTVITTYIVDPKTGEITENVGDPIVVNPTETIIKVPAKTKVELIKNGGKTIEKTTTYDVNPENGNITENVTEKIVSDNNPENPPVVNELPEFNGGVNPNDSIVNEKPEYTGPIGTIPLDVNPNGEQTGDETYLYPPVVNELPEFNGGVNPSDVPANEKPEYTGPLSTNTPVDENGNLILPPVVNELPEFNGGANPTDSLVNEKPEYTGPLSTNTPVDENGNLILPPIINELPEFNGGVNPIDSPVLDIPEYTGPISTNTPVDDNGNLILPPVVKIPGYNGDLTPPKPSVVEETPKEEPAKLTENKPIEEKKEKELPNTNSTSILTTLISSVIGTLGLGYKSKRRK